MLVYRLKVYSLESLKFICRPGELNLSGELFLRVFVRVESFARGGIFQSLVDLGILLLSAFSSDPTILSVPLLYGNNFIKFARAKCQWFFINYNCLFPFFIHLFNVRGAERLASHWQF